jgi:hypothetical protein
MATGEGKRVRTLVIAFLVVLKKAKGGATHARTFIRQLCPSGTVRYYK